MDSIKQLFSFSGKLDTKQFCIGLLISVVSFLVASWVIGFLLTIVGIPLGITKVVLALLAVALFVRVVALVKRAFVNKK